MPYQRPHIPSPLPQTPSDGSSPGFWRSLFGILVYPIYLVITLLTVPLPILFNILHLVVVVLDTVMYPLTSTLRVMFKTFVLAPAGIAKSVLDVFYPIIAFVGGVVGVGCAMGLGAGWVGRTVLNWITGNKSGSKTKGKRGDRGQSKRSDMGGHPERSIKTSRSRAQGESRVLKTSTKTAHSIPASGPEIVLPKHDTKFVLHQTHKPENRDDEKGGRRETRKPKRQPTRESGLPAGYEEVFQGEGRGTAREVHVVGTRKRTHTIGQGSR